MDPNFWTELKISVTELCFKVSKKLIIAIYNHPILSKKLPIPLSPITDEMDLEFYWREYSLYLTIYSWGEIIITSFNNREKHNRCFPSTTDVNIIIEALEKCVDKE